MNPEENVGQVNLNSETKRQPLSSFNFEGKDEAVSYIETTHVADGVDCEVYTFEDDDSKDLGVIRISPGKKTPLQKVLKGDRTVEGYFSGKGKLTITGLDGRQMVYVADGTPEKSIEVSINKGETMQWEADVDSDLTAYEVCFPPYEDGRFENIS